MFKEGAGQMRGFRIVRDPDGILINPFEYMGTQMGYVLTYGEGVPAIHDGNDWVPVVDEETAKNYDDNIQSYLIEQGTKIASAVTNPIYAELATQMGMYAGATASTGSSDTRGPNESTITFGS